MTVNGFERVYRALGELGYRFRDAGHDHKCVIISLSSPISQKHLKQLEDAFSIEENDGAELAFV
jgi:hypothetical protein